MTKTVRDLRNRPAPVRPGLLCDLFELAELVHEPPSQLSFDVEKGMIVERNSEVSDEGEEEDGEVVVSEWFKNLFHAPPVLVSRGSIGDEGIKISSDEPSRLYEGLKGARDPLRDGGEEFNMSRDKIVDELENRGAYQLRSSVSGKRSDRQLTRN